jgi:hypothetical protein
MEEEFKKLNNINDDKIKYRREKLSKSIKYIESALWREPRHNIMEVMKIFNEEVEGLGLTSHD